MNTFLLYLSAYFLMFLLFRIVFEVWNRVDKSTKPFSMDETLFFCLCWPVTIVIMFVVFFDGLIARLGHRIEKRASKQSSDEKKDR